VSDAELARIWHRIRGELRRAVSDSTWHIWLARVDARELDGTTLIVEAPDDIRAWVQGRFHRLLQACALAYLSDDLPTEALTVEILGVIADRAKVDQLLAGWEGVMDKGTNSLQWVRDRLAAA